MSVSTSAHASTWREEKHEHAKDVARALRARCLERNIDSIFELDEFTDEALFTQLGESLLGAKRASPGEIVQAQQPTSGSIVRHEYDAMYGDVRESKSDSEELASPRKSPPTANVPETSTRRHDDGVRALDGATSSVRGRDNVCGSPCGVFRRWDIALRRLRESFPRARETGAEGRRRVSVRDAVDRDARTRRDRRRDDRNDARID